jgi:hypothetical protein
MKFVVKSFEKLKKLQVLTFSGTEAQHVSNAVQNFFAALETFSTAL